AGGKRVASQETGRAADVPVPHPRGRSMMMKFLSCAAFALALAFTAVSASAAGRAGSISGTITDPLGAVVAEATVDLLQGARQAANTTTDRQGVYLFSSVRPGHYSIRARSAGFATQHSEVVYVGPGGEATVDLALKVGTVSQEVVVSATGTRTPE